MLKIDFLDYVIERKLKEEDLIKSPNNQIQLEVPKYYDEYEEKEKKKDSIEPKRVIIIEL
jgi:hypothetical protein